MTPVNPTREPAHPDEASAERAGRATGAQGTSRSNPAASTTPPPVKPAAGAARPSARSGYPESIDRLLTELARLPGIGRRSAERLAFHLLRADPADALRLSRAIEEVKRSIRHCRQCFNFSDGDSCMICASPLRDRTTLMVVEQPKDLLAIEATGMYRGVYHVLMGRISPLEGVGPEDLTIEALRLRVAEPRGNAAAQDAVRVREVILALNPTLEGDGTVLYLIEALREVSPRVGVSRLARGLASGSTIEFANKAVLADALEGRRQV